MLSAPDLAFDNHAFANDREDSRIGGRSTSGAPNRGFRRWRLRSAQGRRCSGRIFVLFTIAPHVCSLQSTELRCPDQSHRVPAFALRCAKFHRQVETGLMMNVVSVGYGHEDMDS